MDLLRPQWPAPPRVRAAVTTRQGGVSLPPCDSLNLADHVGDAPADVAENRRRLRAELALTREPGWLRQVHGTQVVQLPAAGIPEADAAWTNLTDTVCAVLTADCLPVLFCDRDATAVAAAHAGWRGLCDGVLEATVAALPVPPQNLLAWLGPAIGPRAFEVGAEVRERYCDHDAATASCFVAAGGAGKFLADIYALARLRLRNAGVEQVSGGDLCTVSERQRFHSFRRDGRSGRMASLIWLAG